MTPDYDAWKLRSPYDDAPPGERESDVAGECTWCFSTVYQWTLGLVDGGQTCESDASKLFCDDACHAMWHDEVAEGWNDAAE